MQALLAAFNAADVNGAILSLIIMLVAKYAVEIGKVVGGGLISLVHTLQDRGNQTALGQLSEVDDRVFLKITEAVEATMPIAADFKAAAADGKLTKEEIEALKGKALDMFLGSLGVRDYINFGMSYIPGFKATSTVLSRATPKEVVHDKLREKFFDLHTKAVDDTKEIRKLEPTSRARGLLEKRMR